MWKLVIEDDEGKRTVVPLTRDDYTIGRKEGNTIRLTERNVSREHAKLRKNANGSPVDGTPHPAAYTLEDVTSYNGVYVNGLRVAQSQDLVHGDLVQVGDYRMVLQDDQVIEQPTAVPSISADSKTTIPSGAMNRGSLLMERPNRLVMLAGPTPGAEFTLDQERLTIGRAEDAGISVNHNSVSRLHCEVHVLGEGRYEIVDKGSSNGVRVNAAELKRGIIEAGDIIELGDVKFKFVGAGQIFLPGVNDSQQLAAIGDRSVNSVAAGRRSLGVVPYAIAGVVVAAGLASAYYLYTQRNPGGPKPTAPISAVSPSEHDQGVLDEAKKLADANELERAHDKIKNEFLGDTLRTSADYRVIQNRWAQARVSRAEVEVDLTKKRVLLEPVERGEGEVDSALRKQAGQMLRALDMGNPATPLIPVVPDTPVPSARDAAAAAVVVTPPRPDVTVRPVQTNTVVPNANTNGAVTPAVPTPKPTPAPAVSDTERARTALLDDPALAKQLLLVKVLNKKGSPDDFRILLAACKDSRVNDRSCVEKVKEIQGGSK